jgi:hypothetical protein
MKPINLTKKATEEPPKIEVGTFGEEPPNTTDVCHACHVTSDAVKFYENPDNPGYGWDFCDECAEKYVPKK